MIPETEILDRLQRLFVSATRFEQKGGSKAPGLRAKMAVQYLENGNLDAASRAIINSENEMRAHELRELAMKIPSGETHRDALVAIFQQNYSLAEELIIAAGVLD